MWLCLVPLFKWYSAMRGSWFQTVCCFNLALISEWRDMTMPVELKVSLFCFNLIFISGKEEDCIHADKFPLKTKRTFQIFHTSKRYLYLRYWSLPWTKTERVIIRQTLVTFRAPYLDLKVLVQMYRCLSNCGHPELVRLCFKHVRIKVAKGPLHHSEQ